jgi:hypothetical protein
MTLRYDRQTLINSNKVCRNKMFYIVEFSVFLVEIPTYANSLSLSDGES